MRNVLNFLSTRIGISLTVAVVIVGVAVTIKYREAHIRPKGEATLIVEKIIKDSLQNINNIEKNGGFAAATTTPVDNTPILGVESAPYTATDRFSQEIFREYVSAKQNGQEVTPDVSSRIAESVLARDYSDKIELYTATDMKITSSNDITTLKNYGNTLGTILSTAPAGKENELQIFQKLAAGENLAGYQKELTAIKNRYEAMKKGILATPVPKNLAFVAANFANGIGLLIEGTNGALNIENDPIGALNKIAGYDEGVNLIKTSLSNTKKVFTSKGILFSKQEKGFILTE